jgi:hypothetical protein
MSAIESSLRLEISQYQENLARAKGEAAKLKDDIAKKTLGIEEAVLGKTQRYREIVDRVRTEAKALKAELATAQNSALGRESFNAANSPLGQFRKHMQNEGQEAGRGMIAGMRSAINANGAMVVGGLASLVGMATAGLRTGFDFNLVLDNAEVGIGNVLRRFDGLNAAAAKNEAAKALARIVELEPATAGGLDDLTLGFMKTLASAKGIGMTTMENVELTAKFANAVANAGLKMDQLTQEYRSILTGTITKDSQIAKILGITNEDVNQVKRDGGSMFEFLNGKLGEFGEAGDGAQVAFSSAMSAIKTSLGSLSGGLFDETVSSARDLADFLKSHAEDFKAAGAAAGDYLYTFKSGLTEIMGMLAESETLGNVGRLVGKAYTMPNPEEIALAREGDAATRRDTKIKMATDAVNDPTISPEEKTKRQAELIRLMKTELDIHKEARRLMDDEHVGEAAALQRARAMVDLRQKSRGAREVENKGEAEKQAKEKEKLLKLQAQLNQQAVDALPPAERQAAYAKELQGIYAKMQSQTINQPSTKEGVQNVAESRLKYGNTEGAKEAFDWLKRIREIEAEIAKAEKDQVTEQDHKLALEKAIIDQKLDAQAAADKFTEDNARKAEKEQTKQTSQNTALADYKAEMAIIDAQIAGQKEKAAEMQRTLDIARATRELQERTGVPEAEAKKLATQGVDQQIKLEKQQAKGADKPRYDSEGRREDGRRQIRSSIQGDSKDARERAQERVDAARRKSSSARDDKFGSFSAEDDRLKKKFAEQFPGRNGLPDAASGKPLADQHDKNPLAPQAQKNAAAADSKGGGADPQQQAAQQVIALMTQILESVK